MFIKKNIQKCNSKSRGINESGFGLIILIIAAAIIILFAGIYYSRRISTAQQTKTQIKKQTKELEQRVESQMEDLQNKTKDSIEAHQEQN